MKIKKLVSCLLLAALVCCTALTGCSDKGSMFSDMKEISQITSAEFAAEGDISMKSEEEDITMHFTMDGKTNGKDCAVSMSFSSGALTITLDDFIRMTNNTLYINQSSLPSMLTGTDQIDGMKTWISTPVNAADDETRAMSQSFSNTLIDSLEKICKDQDITKDGDAWTLNIPGEKLVSFSGAALDEIDANISSWYDLYVDLLEVSGSDEILKEYSAFTGEEDEGDTEDEGSKEEADEKTDDNDDSDDIIQSLKDDKEDNLNTWKDMSTSLRDSLKDLDASITKKETTASAGMSVSLTGKKGARTAKESVSFRFENNEGSENAGSMSVSISQNLTETADISIEAPDASDVMTMEEYSGIMSDYFGSYSDYDTGLSEEEEQAILSSLKEDQLYLSNTQDDTDDENDLTPCVITVDPKIYTLDQQIGDYGLNLEITGKDSAYASIMYEAGNLEKDLKDYYLPEGVSCSTLSTDAGDVLWYTDTETDEGYVYTYFGLQLDKNSYLLGMTFSETDDKLDAETCIKGMFKNIQPYETAPGSL